jgi:arginyl-tRNA--protein-N-Asp/Glu arginylyltransferase
MFGAAAHEKQVQSIAAALARCGLQPGAEHVCAYLPGRCARHVAFSVEAPFPGLYHALMDLNFRRSGLTFYRPACESCRECRAVRVPVAGFRPSRAQKRCWERNADLEVVVGSPEPTEEKHALYLAYLRGRHDGQMDGSSEEFRGFLYQSRVDTVEVCYRWRGRLVSVAIVDIEPGAMSAVYCYFDPAEQVRSLGVYNVLWLIAACQGSARPYVYIGYWVPGSRAMSYKVRYRPNQVLLESGEWANRPQDCGTIATS